jgi:hypothetical protein
VGDAGGSAQRRYEKLAADHRAGRSRRLILNLSTAVAIAIAAWIAFHEQYPTFFPWIMGVIVFIGFAKAVVERDSSRWRTLNRTVYGCSICLPRAIALSAASRLAVFSADSTEGNQPCGAAARRMPDSHRGDGRAPVSHHAPNPSSHESRCRHAKDRNLGRGAVAVQ